MLSLAVYALENCSSIRPTYRGRTPGWFLPGMLLTCVGKGVFLYGRRIAVVWCFEAGGGGGRHDKKERNWSVFHVV